MKYSFRNPAVSKNGISGAAAIAPSPLTQESERLLNARVFVTSIFPGEESGGGAAVRRLYESLWMRRRHDSVARDLLSILRHPIDVTSYAICHAMRPHSLVLMQRALTIVEPEPNPMSRVTLSKERDRLGLNRVQLDWRVGAKEKRTIQRMNELIDIELRRQNLGELQLDRDLADANDVWPERLSWCWHNMGTT